MSAWILTFTPFTSKLHFTVHPFSVILISTSGAGRRLCLRKPETENSNKFNTELNDLRIIICLRKSEIPVKRISVCNVQTLVISKSNGPSETL